MKILRMLSMSAYCNTVAFKWTEQKMIRNRFFHHFTPNSWNLFFLAHAEQIRLWASLTDCDNWDVSFYECFRSWSTPCVTVSRRSGKFVRMDSIECTFIHREFVCLRVFSQISGESNAMAVGWGRATQKLCILPSTASVMRSRDL